MLVEGLTRVLASCRDGGFTTWTKVFCRFETLGNDKDNATNDDESEETAKANLKITMTFIGHMTLPIFIIVLVTISA